MQEVKVKMIKIKAWCNRASLCERENPAKEKTDEILEFTLITEGILIF